MVEEAAERGDQWAEAMLVTLQALLALWGGRIDEAARRAGEAQRIFRTIGDRYGEIQAAATIARTLAAQGLSVDALRMAEEAVGLATPIGQGTLAQSVTASVAMYAGQSGRAIAHAHLALDAPDVPPGFGYDPFVTLALAHLQQGEVDAAMTYAEQAAATRPDHPNGTQALALVTAAMGRPAEAVALAESVAEMRSATYMDRFLAGLALALGQAQLGKAPDTMEALEAVEVAIEATDDAAAPGARPSWPGPRRSTSLGDDAGAALAQEEAGRRAEVLDLDPAPGSWPSAWWREETPAAAERLLAGRSALTERAWRPGLIVGRFCPPHLGHSHLIDAAPPRRSTGSWCSSTRVTVRRCRGSCGHSGWPTATPRSRGGGAPRPATPTSATRSCWQRWISLFRARWPEELVGEGPAVVFSSDPYADELARRLGAVVRGRRCRPHHRAHLGHAASASGRPSTSTTSRRASGRGSRPRG